MDLYANQQQRLIAVANKKRATRVVRGTDRLTEASNETNDNIHEANLLWSQANTAGGWHILRHEIANFLNRVE